MMSATLEPIHADLIQPFTLEGAAVRGRLVRLGVLVDTILSRHAYPDAVSHVLGELLVVAAMLSSNLKQEGIFTIQLRGNGLVPMLVVDAVYGGALRGYADLAEESIAALNALPKQSTPAQLFGQDSYLAITYDPGKGMQRYQGVVALVGDSIASALQEYFTQSQQLDVWYALACDKVAGSNSWAAAGLMIERIADAGGTKIGEGEGAILDTSEIWRTALALSNTVKTEELLDVTLPLDDLLFRLYHENDARITPAGPLTIGCRCSRERIYDLLMSMSLSDRAEMIVSGTASVNCQFCNKSEIFTPEEIGIASVQ